MYGAQKSQTMFLHYISRVEYMFGLKFRSTYVKLAYLQSATALNRAIYIKNPTEEFELEPNE